MHSNSVGLQNLDLPQGATHHVTCNALSLHMNARYSRPAAALAQYKQCPAAAMQGHILLAVPYTSSARQERLGCLGGAQLLQQPPQLRQLCQGLEQGNQACEAVGSGPSKPDCHGLLPHDAQNMSSRRLRAGDHSSTAWCTCW